MIYKAGNYFGGKHLHVRAPSCGKKRVAKPGRAVYPAPQSFGSHQRRTVDKIKLCQLGKGIGPNTKWLFVVFHVLRLLIHFNIRNNTLIIKVVCYFYFIAKLFYFRKTMHGSSKNLMRFLRKASKVFPRTLLALFRHIIIFFLWSLLL